jgi:hypothetical protein
VARAGDGTGAWPDRDSSSGPGKREAGVNPARSRHCDRGANPRHATGELEGVDPSMRTGKVRGASIRESGDLSRGGSQEHAFLRVRGGAP